MANEVDLDWDAREVQSYLSLFNLLKDTRALKVRHLSFDDFKGITVTAADLGVKAADLTRSDRTPA